MFTAVTLTPGVNTTETPALNSAGVSSCNLIRYQLDPKFGGLLQKLGGWGRYFPSPMSAIVRALWAWEDTESSAHLAVWTENIAGTFKSELSVITEITPQTKTDNIAPSAGTTAGSSLVTINDTTIQNITQYDAVYIPAHISIGGLILFGLYACDPDGTVATTSYTVQAHDVLGNPLPAPATSTTATVASFSVASGSPIVTVTLAAHGYQVGNIYPILIPVSVGGISLFNHYPVVKVIDANTFTILAPNSATSTTTASINNGKARFVYTFGIGAIPPGTGFGVGGFGVGGFGVGQGITPQTGDPINAVDGSLGNWGEILLASPIAASVALTTTGASAAAGTATLTFGIGYLIPLGSIVVVSGVTPNGYNGTYFVTASTLNSVSFVSAGTGAQTVAGTISVQVVSFQPIYMWDAEHAAPVATVIANAPPVNDGFYVAMPQKQIVAWGSTFTGVPDPLLARWCDVNDFDTWVGQPTNQAGSYRLTRGSHIVGGLQGPQQGYLWTDIGLWSVQYIGQPYVYSFNEIGTGCGMIGRKAGGVLSDTVFWMGALQFFRLDADVNVLPCTVWDVVFQNMDTSDTSKIRFAANALFNEVAWYYPSLNGGGEIDSYVKYNTVLNAWDYGTLGRSAWVDQSVLGPPIGADPANLYLYQHETSPDADGQAMLSWARTGFWAASETSQQMFIDHVRPDFKYGTYAGAQNATVDMSFFVTDYAAEAVVTHGPYPVTQSTKFFTTRMRGNLISLQFGSSDVGSFWRTGAIRYRVSADGEF